MTDVPATIRPRRRRVSSPSIDQLSPRERQVLAGVARGMTNKAIGAQLGISHRTVETHRARVMRKLGATTAAELIAITNAAELPRANEGIIRNSTDRLGRKGRAPSARSDKNL